MKKAFTLFLSLLLLFSVGMCAAVAVINSRLEAVTVELVSQQGDPSVLNGLQIELESYCEHLRWNTVFTPSDGTARTESKYMGVSGNNFYDYDEEPKTYGIVFEEITSDRESYDIDPIGFSRAYHELRLDTPVGQRGTRTVYVRDYVDYYRFSAHISTPSDSYYFSHDTIAKNKAEEQLYQDLHTFFRIPVLESETVSISIQTDETGEIVHAWSSETSGDSFDLNVVKENCVVTQDAIYFSFSNRTSMGEIVDTSLIPGGYGIYCLPFGKVCDHMLETPFRGDELSRVFSMEEETQFLGLRGSMEQDRLLLHTIENGCYVLTVIDIETMAVLQRMEVAPYDEQNPYWTLRTDGQQDLFLVEMPMAQYALFWREEDGRYAMRYPFREDIGRRVMDVFRTDMAWKGGYLAVGTPDHWKDSGANEPNFVLEVYDSGRLCYRGEYKFSLTGCDMAYRDPIVLAWN